MGACLPAREGARAVFQLLQGEAAAAKWLFLQEKAALRSAQSATCELENRSRPRLDEGVESHALSPAESRARRDWRAFRPPPRDFFCIQNRMELRQAEQFQSYSILARFLPRGRFLRGAADFSKSSPSPGAFAKIIPIPIFFSHIDPDHMFTFL
jgi:hypothetical protein